MEVDTLNILGGKTMKTKVGQLSKVGKTEKQKSSSPNSHKYEEIRTREYLLPNEVETILSATKKSKCRHRHRNYTIIGQAGKLARLPFPIHTHMLRHSTGYYLANKGIDTRTIQSYLGHRNIQHTVRYTEKTVSER